MNFLDHRIKLGVLSNGYYTFKWDNYISLQRFPTKRIAVATIKYIVKHYGPMKNGLQHLQNWEYWNVDIDTPAHRF